MPPADKQDEVLERIEALTEKVKRLERSQLSYFGVFVTVIFALIATWLGTIVIGMLIVTSR